MDEDLIKNSFCVEVNKKTINRHIFIIKIMLGLISIYATLQGMWWYKILSKANYNKSTNDFFNYGLAPLLTGVLIIVSIFSWVFYLQGVTLIKQSFIRNEAAFFNTGYKKVFIASLVTILGFTLSCLEFAAYLIIS